MKRLFKRILSLSFALMLLATVCSPAAAANPEIAGIYVLVGGSCQQNATDCNSLETNTFVKKNPDEAYLVTKVQFTNGVDFATNEISAKSSKDVTSFDYTFGIRSTIDYTPIGVYHTHAVQGGTEDPEGYAYYDYTDISLP